MAGHIAAQNGLKRIAKLLLRHGAALDAQNNRGCTPLHYCFTYGYGGLGQYLIGKGADLDKRDHNNMTAAMHAAYVGKDGVLAQLEDAGAELSPGCRGPHH